MLPTFRGLTAGGWAWGTAIARLAGWVWQKRVETQSNIKGAIGVSLNKQKLMYNMRLVL